MSVEQQNFCIIKRNKFYAQLYDLLEEEELFMQKPEDTSQIMFKIKKLVDKSKIFILSNSYNKKNIAEEMVISITENNKDDNIQGHTLFVYADDNVMYEVFFMENLIDKPNVDVINEFCSISNIDMQPIFWDCAMVKTSYHNGILEGVNIDKEDIFRILIENFYHYGVMINPNGTMQDIQFTGENPFNVIGKFNVLGHTDIIGFQLIFYNDEGTEINENASKLYGQTIKGRLFVALLSPMSNKKIWSIKSTTVNNILKILKNPDKIEKIKNEIELNEKYVNPFFILKKTCQE
jgi:hypothetical protein